MLRFGTDGVRGNAATELDTPFVRALARACAAVIGVAKPFLIGWDTRESGPRIASDFATGIVAAGGTIEMLGVLPTPAIAFASQRALCPAVVISASHNPFADNGIKVFAPGGLKLDDATQDAIEHLLHESVLAADDGASAPVDVGAVATETVDKYVQHLVGAVGGTALQSLRVVVDAANGAASALAERVFAACGASVLVIHDTPDGRNINDQCGSTYPDALQRAVIERSAHVGFALDGDADRCIAVDEAGTLIDGDAILVTLGLDLHDRGELLGDTVVVTVLSNLGLHRAFRAAGIAVVETPVGDRAVMQAIEAGGFALGGEQSGHVIVRDRATTGDGLLTALLFSEVLARREMRASTAREQMTPSPQVMINVAVRDPRVVAADPEVVAVIAATRDRFGDSGRVLVRPSGTEPLVRVMVEAATDAEARGAAQRIAAVIEQLSA